MLEPIRTLVALGALTLGMAVAPAPADGAG